MELRTEQRDDTLIVHLKGEIDVESAPRAKRVIDREYEAGSARHLLLNLQGVDFMDSSGVGLILGRYNQVQAAGGKVALCCVPDNLYPVMKLSGIPKIIDIYAGQSSALLKLSGGG